MLQNLEPKRVFYYFEEISKIPRGSGNTKAISDYLASFARTHQLKYEQDQTQNVIIYKAATKGCEQAPTVILQGHMDMVCEKNQNCSHDFKKDGIELILEGNRLRANNTTLGGDDGIALAYALAVLESDSVRHPALEAVFTVDEEVGMDGAKALDATKLKGSYILNIDSEEEGILWASCAGGLRCKCRLPLEFEPLRTGFDCALLTVKGLLGGHSGTEIDKGRQNANCLLSRVLFMLQTKIEYCLIDLFGGMKDNAIPREAGAMIAVPQEKMDCLKQAASDIAAALKKQYQSKEPNMKIELVKTEHAEKRITPKAQEKALRLLLALPNGVQEMSAHIEGLVETSLNIGVINIKNNELTLDISVRSSVDSAKEYLKEKIATITKLSGGECRASGYYPAWEFREHSKLREICSQTFKQLFQQELSVQAMHAGLECGILCDKLKHADCVSFGPNIMEIHTPNEWMDTDSVERMYQFLIKTLENITEVS